MIRCDICVYFELILQCNDESFFEISDNVTKYSIERDFNRTSDIVLPHFCIPEVNIM